MNIGSRPHLGTDTARHSPRNGSAGGDRCPRWGADNKIALGVYQDISGPTLGRIPPVTRRETRVPGVDPLPGVGPSSFLDLD